MADSGQEQRLADFVTLRSIRNDDDARGERGIVHMYMLSLLSSGLKPQPQR